MRIKRDIYLNKLKERQNNGAVKVITGIRRCGKSYLLNELYYEYLLAQGVTTDHIIKLGLDQEKNEEFLDRKLLGEYLRAQIKDEGAYYIFLDEIQLVPEFEKLVNGLTARPQIDLYITGSNSKFLSSDILTEFRGRGDEIRIRPLCFREFFSVWEGSKDDCWQEYFTYGGMPAILMRTTDEAKVQYLHALWQQVYLQDVIERNRIRQTEELSALVNVLASSVGSLTNPLKLANTFQSSGAKNISDKTINFYLQCLQEAFLVEKVSRYNVKGKKYIGSPFKFYFTDVGLRNSKLNYRQQEENHIMENIIYNELLIRGYNVDVGVVETVDKEQNGRRKYKQLEIDFVCNKGSERCYIQSAFALPDMEKLAQEQLPLLRAPDEFKKIILVKDDTKLWRSEQGVTIMGLKDFLLREDSLFL